MEQFNLKNIIFKTIFFLVIMAYILTFQAIFGSENLLIGVSTLVTLLMLLSKDLTKDPVHNFLELLFINLAMGIGGYISYQNVWLGIIVDFMVISLIAYYFSYAMTKGLIVPLGLQYLFIINTPVYGKEFITRLIGLGAGAVFVMISQFIINTKKNSSLKKESTLISINGRKSDKLYVTVKIFGRDVKIHKIRASYAIRVGILTALTSFFVNYFKLAEGRWMTYTIFSLTELYSENTEIKAKQKIQGTIIGVVILLVLFYFVKSKTLRTIMMLLAGYLNSFAVDYKDMMILITITAVAPVALSSGEEYAVIQRIFYVIVGVILALCANKLILRKSKADYEE